MPTARSNKLSKGQRDALKAIAAGAGSFHRLIGDRLEAAGLAFPVSGIFNFLVGCNSRSADGWVLTPAGSAAIGLSLASTEA
jgi:hypothetical protein